MRFQNIPPDFTGTKGKSIYDLVSGFDDRYEKLVEEIRNNTRTGDRVLDVGCGEGKIWSLFKGIVVTGLDISKENLRKAKKYLRPVLGSAEQIPFKDESFNMVVASDILEHLPEPRKAINEISRVLKDGGRSIVTIPNTGGVQFWLSLFIWGRNPSLNYPENRNHIRFFSLVDFRKLLAQTKLRVIKVRGSSFLAFHKENFGVYIPVPRFIRFFGGDLFPRLSKGNLIVLEKKQ